MGVHQLCLEQFMEPMRDRDRLGIALHERVETIIDTLDSIMCIDFRIRHSDALDTIASELSKIRKISDQMCRP